MSLNTKELTIASLTGGEQKGSGLFDELMRSVASHIQSEFDAGRLTEQNFSSVYLGAMQTTIQEASRYLLQHEITNQQIRLLDEQIADAKLQATLTQAQIDLSVGQLLHTTKQTLKLTSDIALVDAQVLVQGKQLLVMDEAIANAQKDLLVKDSSITLQGKQGLMVDQQKANEITRNAQILSQTAKIAAETGILDQRAVSEEAQTKDVVGGLAVGGIIGKQMALYENQADGYIRDAEQKAAKLMNDSFVTRVTTDWDNPNAVDAGVDDTEMGKVILKLKQGINVI